MRAKAQMTSPVHDPGDLAPVLDWLDERFGPILRLLCFRPASPEPEWWTYLCDLSRPIARRFSAHSNNSQGTSINPSQALQRALGEALERYISVNSLDRSDLQILSAEESAVLDSLPRCASDENCPPSFKTFSPDLQLTQCRMTNLSNGQTTFLPAGYVHFAFEPSTDEAPVTISTSSGTAFHTDLPRAILGGLCELAERDAAMSFWLNRRPAARIHFDSSNLPFDLYDRLSRIERTGLEALLFDISSDFPMPAVLCVLSGSSYPYQVFAAACHPDPVWSCTKALDEAVAVRFKQLNSSRRVKVPTRESFDWVHDFDDHSELYASWEDCPVLDFFMPASEETSFSEFSQRQWWKNVRDMEDLQALSRRLDTLGLSVLWTDITAGDASRFGVCARVVVPEMIPLSVDHRVRWLATRRLYQREPGSGASTACFNPFPHPFA